MNVKEVKIVKRSEKDSDSLWRCFYLSHWMVAFLTSPLRQNEPFKVIKGPIFICDWSHRHCWNSKWLLFTFYPSGQMEKGLQMSSQRAILSENRTRCWFWIEVWGADLELSSSAAACDAAASKGSFGTSHVCEKLNPLDPFNADPAQHHWYGCGGGGPIWSNSPNRGFFIITAKYLMTKNRYWPGCWKQETIV